MIETSSFKTRRELLGVLGGLGAGVLLVACGGSDNDRAAGNSSPTRSAPAGSAPTSATTATSCGEIPEETGGPYPGDGSNGPDVLTADGVVRRDIRSSFGSASGVAQGVPLTIELTVVDTANGCTPLEGAAVYLWHCDRDGNYSMYSPATSGENYLRGVQAADTSGRLTFASTFPGAYQGRWPHIHFQVYPDVASASSATNKLATSQIALPEDVCSAVYATDGYGQSVNNLAQTSLATDMVFSDGYSLQMAKLTGDPSSGYTAALVVAV
jgi:protocatechuate 3,4-dioxygenase beta subunit